MNLPHGWYFDRVKEGPYYHLYDPANRWVVGTWSFKEAAKFAADMNRPVVAQD